MTDEILTIDDLRNMLILPGADLVANPSNLPNCPGIYAIYDADKSLAYIGRSIGVSSRLRDHLKRTIFFNAVPAFFSFREIADPVLQRHMEVAHIHAIQPPENMRYEPAYWPRHAEVSALLKEAWGRP